MGERILSPAVFTAINTDFDFVGTVPEFVRIGVHYQAFRLTVASGRRRKALI
jgi:hypothetical protein